jgi:hypothetical protein
MCKNNYLLDYKNTKHLTNLLEKLVELSLIEHFFVILQLIF